MAKNEEKLVDILEKIGLSEHESAVYFASISLGPTTALTQSRASGVKRSTVYSVIETLKRKGLMAEELRGLKTVFFANNPDKLGDVLNERKDLLGKHLEEFKTLYNLNEEEGTIRYYEGLEAIKSVYDGVLSDIKVREDYSVIADVDEWHKLDPKYFDKFRDRRARMNINMRLIFTDSEEAREAKKFERNFNQKVRILPEGTNLKTSLIVTPQKVVIHQYNPPISAIIIQTKSAIQLQKEMFEIIWNSLPE